MRILLLLTSMLLLSLPVLSQGPAEVNPPPYILSVRFTGPTGDQFPIVRLGETMVLEFDDLSASEQDYYFRITHCNYDWSPSALLKSQYLDGTDNQRITDYINSYNTLQPYSNYRLELPNPSLKFRVSGNYLLEIYNNADELIFTRRFVIYEDRVKVSAQVKRSRDFNYLNSRQVVHFAIRAGDFDWVNPQQEIKVAIIQNYYWPGALYHIKPQYALGNELVYRYDEKTGFLGGNEFLFFDTKDLRAPSAHISKVTYEDIYNHFLFPDDYRYDQPYTYFPDINGDFVIRTTQGFNGAREAEYSDVHFSLPYSTFIGKSKVYIFGKFNNYAFEESNRMQYNPDTGYMEAVLRLKQGFYNYRYALVDEDGSIRTSAVGGNFHFTENNYTILVYYRRFGNVYDSVIGIGNANSRDITN